MRIGTRAEAERLVTGVLGVMTDLQGLLEAETGHIRVGRFREGLAQEARKSEMAAAYIQGLEAEGQRRRPRPPGAGRPGPPEEGASGLRPGGAGQPGGAGHRPCRFGNPGQGHRRGDEPPGPPAGLRAPGAAAKPAVTSAPLVVSKRL